MLLTEIPTLANINNYNKNTNYLYSEILLSLRFMINNVVARTHKFKVILS